MEGDNIDLAADDISQFLEVEHLQTTMPNGPEPDHMGEIIEPDYLVRDEDRENTIRDGSDDEEEFYERTGAVDDPPPVLQGNPHTRPAPRKQQQGSVAAQAAATAGDIDPALNSADMLMLLYAERTRKKTSGHHLDSMNSFYRTGMRQIITKVFTIDRTIRNQRDKDEEDRQIDEIKYHVEFTDVKQYPPTTRKYKSGSVQVLTPAMARVKGKTYACPTFIDAKITATATLKDGSTKVRTDEVKDARIGAIPCMVGSELCNTYNCSAETLKALEEDPRDPGGYFIIKGYEWTVDNLENMAHNSFQVHKNMHQNELARGSFLSKPGDAFENSYELIMRYLNTGAITIEITANKHNKMEIPYFLIFRALGMTRDSEIIDNIVYGLHNTDPVSTSLMSMLERAFNAPDPMFGPLRQNTNPAEIIQFIAARITQANTEAAKKDDNIAKYLNGDIASIFDTYILPHIGNGIEHRIRKLRFLGHLINKLLRVYMGIVEPTDRDRYDESVKLVHAAGISLAKTLKTTFNYAIVQEIRNRLDKDFKSTPFSSVQMAESIKTAVNSDDLERMMSQSITSGNKTITIRRSEITNRVSSQTLYRKNDLNAFSTLNTINTPNTSSNKQNERADVMRRVHPSYTGFVDPSQSADTGEGVGMSRQMTIGASITGASSGALLRAELLADPDVIPLDDCVPARISAEKLAKIFVNGYWVGLCARSHDLARKYREKRRASEIHPDVSIVWEIAQRELYFYTCFGRVRRPLVIVYNNLEEYIDNWRNGDRTAKFRQWVRLTHEHVQGLRRGTVTISDLRAQGILEYITAGEQRNTYIAANLDILRQNVGSLQHIFTHLDCDQALFGIVTLASPGVDHSNATRNTYFTNQRKQAAGWFALNYPYRIDKNTTFQHYCEYPLVSTLSDAETNPCGMNPIVAIISHGGFNMEDSITANASSIDCGMYNAAVYTSEKAELDKNEQFGNPDYAQTLDIKRDATYEFTENGVVKENTVVRRNTVMIVRSSKMPKPVGTYLYVDRSVVYKKNEPVFVERVIRTRNDDDAFFVKLKLRANRPLGVGDKMSSRTGNKGIVANLVPRCDMPFTESGLIPDLLVNPHSIPTRMAINQLIECMLSLLAAMMGTHIDMTAFRNHDIPQVMKMLEAYGVKYGGHQRMYNGRTGDWLDTMIFIGPTTYQRLLKYVIDDHYAMRTGPTNAITNQPTEGKNMEGGLRLGEMEKDVMCAHGTARAIDEKFYTDSDGASVPICRGCGNRAIVNEKLNLYRCKYCGDDADIANVRASTAANVLWAECAAMNVKMTFGLQPHAYPEHEGTDKQ